MDISAEKKLMRYNRMVDALLGNESADLLLHGGFIINVLTREIYAGDIAIKNEYILMTGDCGAVVGEGTKIVDVSGKYLCPGFIDAHMHFESSLLTATEFSRLSIASGTTTLFADPHEIANVCGMAGVRAMLDEARHLPNRILFTIPALTPDVPGLETAGGEISSANIRELLDDPLVQGLGEMQGFSNVLPVYSHNRELIEDLLTSVYYTKALGKTVEGNAPALFGAQLAAHQIVCGSEISCHETTTKEECAEKLRNGVTVFMREGSTQRNMAECIRVVTEDGLDSRKLVLATDDMVAEDLLSKGHMNEIIRRTIAQGVDPVEAIQMATVNPARHFGRKDIGVLCPGKAADICVIGDLMVMRIDAVYIAGKLAARDGKLLAEIPPCTYPEEVKHSMKCAQITANDLKIASARLTERVRAIEVIVDQNLTGCKEAVLEVKEGFISPSVAQDVLPLVSVERHGKSSRRGKTFVTGMGLQTGAIAQSIAHDTHNLLVCGADYFDMALAANRVIAMGGGIAMVKGGKVIGDLELPIAGLMTDLIRGEQVCEKLRELHEKAKSELGCTIHSPFMHLSFLSLVTSPKWKISDMGLVDTESCEIIPTIMEGEDAL